MVPGEGDCVRDWPILVTLSSIDSSAGTEPGTGLRGRSCKPGIGKNAGQELEEPEARAKERGVEEKGYLAPKETVRACGGFWRL